ncbi:MULTISPECIES: hotdog domain-containing protein [Paraburkholderia]|jgi:acyl-CoA hydrolase|uniref:Acyl-CoA thioesterase n=1 Tax=Paraburkholderia largidicola TaxID=3014751 RepID=A0A7I8BTG8_9BURK|nr:MULTISPECIES: hotdog domain-containing protein [Paraburkholderia]BCF91805.1 acyl-CoA thioesterase [Paraburkholderia sp. PGU16]BEU23184.1 hotdog domain-containing protein [Paraburkholderia sp. 22B1P]GJH35436.1 acyl-CoA thioesterase [Paraburkholderia hospita]CAG9251091.1 cytosolic long-chain acyl-CoA thioester hydrolase family protein [Paraburkholderia caribensis]
MNFHTRKWVKPEDLNPNGTLFGGSLLRWIDEEAAIYAICQLDNQRVVTKFMSEINFVSSARQGDIIELGMTATHFGTTSITLRAEVRNKITRKSILTVEKMVFVNLDANGDPAPHGRTKIRYSDEAFERYSESLRAMQQQPVVLAAESAEDVDQEADAAH